MSQVPRIFNRRAVRRHRDRAAAGFEAYRFLIEDVAERLADRLDDVRRTFPRALDLGCHTGVLGRLLGGRGGIAHRVQCDLSPAMAARSAETAGAAAVAADEEALPFAPESFDLVLSAFSLHWVNDLPGTLAQVRRVLRPDGLFLAAMPGGATLHELRTVLAEAEIAEAGGLSPRVSPFVDVRDAGALLQRAGFALPVVDVDTITVRYGDPLRLMADLRGMGESNAVAGRWPAITRRAVIAGAATRYRAAFAEADGRVPATFQILFLTAWAPHPAQPQPARPGSATVSLATACGGPPPAPAPEASRRRARGPDGP